MQKREFNSNRGFSHLLFSLLLAVLCGMVCAVSLLTAAELPSAASGSQLELYGKIVSPRGSGVGDVRLTVFIDGTPLVAGAAAGAGKSNGALTTEADGSYQIRQPLGASTLAAATTVTIQAHRPGFSETTIRLTGADFIQQANSYVAIIDIEIQRTTGPAFWIAATVFLLIYLIISFELLHRTLAAMLGASLMLVVSSTLGTFNPEYHILSYERAVAAIDMNVIFLLMGMMIIVGILKHTGMFQWCAYKCYQLARGNVILLAIILMSFTAVSSAFLDNVTTMLVLTPVTIEIALSLGINPIALLLPEILASNIGGTTTLIGDPPNIMIGSYAGLTFVSFVENLAPICIVALFILFIYCRFVYGEEYKKSKVEDVTAFICQLRKEYRITDTTLLMFGIFVMGLVVAMFLTHGIWHMEVSIAALFGASLLFTYGLLSRKVDLLLLIEKDIEWATLLFFIFLFILVGGVQETGLLDIIADWVLRMSHGNLVLAICLILWVSALMSAFVDNIPFTATMLPVVSYLTEVIPGAESGVLWWALAFGACFGGNGTMIGASANVVTLGIAEAAGFPIRFIGFIKVAFPYMIVSVILANVWLLLAY